MKKRAKNDRLYIVFNNKKLLKHKFSLYKIHIPLLSQSPNDDF